MARPSRRLAITTLAFLALLLSVSAPLRAQQADVLSVEIVAADGEPEQRLELDRAALADLPQTEFVTRTIWTDGPQRFRGVALSTLLAYLDVTASHLEFEAVNDYTMTLPAQEIGPDYPVIALTRNGVAMSLRDMGPFWLVYNYDSDPKFRTETVYARSIWQLERITVRLAGR
ncbi:oxidoreductase [Roseovarius autotrophicus]|uniref:oxidoreductase n=1 Tax=Roseovarius autotrophicus TaxID=2824121 RepID=UPI001A108E47|nr:oxidoreductase [Roseovarius autotrophicus]MBE0452322.1 oxidoreductase [Roseovarius sp.]